MSDNWPQQMLAVFMLVGGVNLTVEDGWVGLVGAALLGIFVAIVMTDR